MYLDLAVMLQAELFAELAVDVRSTCTAEPLYKNTLNYGYLSK